MSRYHAQSIRFGSSSVIISSTVVLASMTAFPVPVDLQNNHDENRVILVSNSYSFDIIDQRTLPPIRKTTRGEFVGVGQSTPDLTTRLEIPNNIVG